MSQNDSANPVKNVLFVHGAFADASSWNKVIPMLKAKGLHAAVVRKPLTAIVMMSIDVRFSAMVHTRAGSPEGAR
jgi:hypothetical protein